MYLDCTYGLNIVSCISEAYSTEVFYIEHMCMRNKMLWANKQFMNSDLPHLFGSVCGSVMIIAYYNGRCSAW